MWLRESGVAPAQVIVDDEGNSIAQAFDRSIIPTWVFADGDSRVLGRHVGELGRG